jgi:prepilin-type N-terminal cleavage/methylation domain-containing protein
MNSESNNGYTIIELMVVLAIFFVIVGITVDIFISVLQQQKRILAEQELLNQGSYAIEYISRALKMAVKDPTGACLGAPGAVYQLTHCLNGTLTACNGVKFINQSDSNACQEFFLDEAVSPANPPLREIKNGATAQNLLAIAFTVKYGRFILNGDKTLHTATASDTVQPRITVLLDVQTPAPNQQEKIIQTTVSQRNLIQ